MAVLDAIGARQLSTDDVAALFPGASWLEVLGYANEPPPIHFVDRSLELDTLAPGPGPWALIIHGDLHATADLDFATGDYKCSLLVVQGNVRARNFRFTNGATCVVAHDLAVTDFIVGRYGDESARLEVGGTLRARALFLDHVTGADARELDAIVCTTVGWGLPIDIDYHGEHGDTFVADVRDDDRLDLHAVWRAATRGAPIFLPGVEAELRARVITRRARQDRGG